MTAVEYQGASVALSAKTEAGDEMLALLPEDVFFASPKNPGDAVRLAWDDGRVSRLQA